MAGCCPGELKALRWSDLGLDRGSFSIQRHAQRIVGVGIVIGQTKTAGSRRPVAVGADVVALLRRHRVEQAKERLAMGPLWTDQGLVFPSESGSVLEDKRVHHVFQRICERAGVPLIRPYDLRHRSARPLLAAGVHPRIVAERLGHSNAKLALNT
jgi:integrase